jgi:hypothetical protein
MQKKNEIQESLFDKLRQEVPKHTPLVSHVAETLGLTVDSAYRRIRGEMDLSIQEVSKLCRRFNLSFDELMYGMNKMHYAFIPSDLRDLRSYVSALHDLALITERENMAYGSEIVMAVADISLFHYTAYQELALFLLFSWDKNAYDYSGTYEDFVSGLDTDAVARYNSQITHNYQKTPSSEVWNDHVVESVLKIIKYHFEMDHFQDSAIPLLICNQLMDMICTLQEWARAGVKGSGGSPIKFYTIDVDTGNTIIAIRNEDRSMSIIRLFTNNGLIIKDKPFFREVDNWLDSLMKRATLISSVSTRERFKFFTAQKQKIQSMIDFITCHCTVQQGRSN